MYINRNVQKFAKSNPGLFSEKLNFLTNYNTITVVKIQEHYEENELVMSIYIYINYL